MTVMARARPGQSDRGQAEEHGKAGGGPALAGIARRRITRVGGLAHQVGHSAGKEFCGTVPPRRDVKQLDHPWAVECW